MSTAQDTIRAYHQRTKHQLQRYAAGPDTLDWDAQPDPFRSWQGAPLTMLPLVADTLKPTWADLFEPGKVPARSLTLKALGTLLELSLGLTAWKQYGPDRWALRANPSSGNLHPTEAYVLARGVAGLADGLYHYAPREHALALRALLKDDVAATLAPQMWLGLSSVQWREAWKYGERAFRYCQLDTGHAVGGLRYAAAVLGWQAAVLPGLTHAHLAGLMGLDRDADFGTAEREEPEVLLQVGPMAASQATPSIDWIDANSWQGQASRLDARPMYRWPVIDEVAKASRADAEIVVKPALDNAVEPPMACVTSASHAGEPASFLIRGRRSAQHFDKRGHMPLETFMRMLQALMPGCGLPWDAWPLAPRVHPVFFVHRVDGLTPGAYILPRSPSGATVLTGAVSTGSEWLGVASAPASVPLQCLVEHPGLSGTLRTLSCHQAIGSDACFAVSLLAEFDDEIDASPAAYRELYQEAGLIGQVLYLQAEAEGYRGTGIGCYFDDAVHELLGIKSHKLQVLYHFTVGVPTVDTRISTELPYPGHAPASELD